MDSTYYSVWLTTLVGVRSVTIRRLFSRFGSSECVFRAAEDELRQLTWLQEKERSALLEKDLSRTDRILAVCSEKNIRILPLHAKDYPERLCEISDPPAVLYLRGSFADLNDRLTVALVGTRRASAYGLKMADSLAGDLASHGVAVVTGLAKGIDTACAESALRRGGLVIGVLGTAIDEYYPKENAALIDAVAQSGAVISEYPPEYPTLPANFPRRNRIISGLSHGTCVVEAPLRSGAVITGNLAIDQGRDLFVVPANADSVSGRGSNRLLQNCGKLVMTSDDILEEYEALFPTVTEVSAAPPLPAPDEKSEVDKPQAIPYITIQSSLGCYPPEQQKILTALLGGERQADEIVNETGLPVSVVLSQLTMLCIRGTVTSLPGKRYTLK